MSVLNKVSEVLVPQKQIYRVTCEGTVGDDDTAQLLFDVKATSIAQAAKLVEDIRLPETFEEIIIELFRE